jgi:hypothetical protein
MTTPRHGFACLRTVSLALLGIAVVQWRAAPDATPTTPEQAMPRSTTADPKPHPRAHDDASGVFGSAAPPLPAAVDGTVRAEDGTPVIGSEVCAWSTAAEAVDAIPACTATGVAGRYHLELHARAVVMSATAAGFLPNHAPATASTNGVLVLVPGERRRAVDFRIGRGGHELRGTVTDVFGGVIEGAVLTLAHGWAGRSESGHRIAGTPVLTRSNADGGFSVWLAPGQWVLNARAPGYSGATIASPVPGASVAIALVPEATLSGIVVDSVDGTAVPGATIVLRTWRHGTSEDRVVGESDDSGHFRIGGLAPGRYRPGAIAGERSGESAHSVSVDLAESVEDVRIEVFRGATLAATVVVAPAGTPCPGGSVTLVDPATRDTRVASIAPDGAVRLDGLGPARYDLAIACDEHSSEATDKSIQIDHGENTATWTVQPGHTIRGTVVDADGNGLFAEVTAIATSTDADGTFRRVSSTAEGGFEIRGVSAGSHSLSASDGTRPRTHSTVVVDADVVEVVLREAPLGKLRGVVARRGTPLGQIEVRARPVTPGQPMVDTQTDDRGTFAFDALVPGRYEVVAADDAEVRIGVQQVEIRAKTTARINFEAEAEASIEGQLVDTEGRPVADATVAAIASNYLSSEEDRTDTLRERARAGSRGTVLTDADGRFMIPGLARETTYTVLAQRRGGGVATKANVATGSAVTLRLAKLADVRGTVSGTGSVTGLSVALRRRDGGSSLRESFRFGSSFEFERVPPGSYDVIAVAREGRGRSTVVVAAGERAQVAVELQANRTYRGRFVDVHTGAPVPDVFAVIADEDADASELATKAEQLIAARPDGMSSGADGRFTVAETPSATARLLAISSDVGGGIPSVLEFIVIAPGAERADVVDVPVLNRSAKRTASVETGFEFESPMFCTDTPHVTGVTTRAASVGLAIGDEIVAVDGHDTTGLRCYLARDLLEAPEADHVELTLGDGRTVTVPLVPGG